MLWWSFLQLFLSLCPQQLKKKAELLESSLALMLEDFRIPPSAVFFWKSLLFRLLLQPLSCQKKNISRNFIYNIFLVTFLTHLPRLQELQTELGTSFNRRRIPPREEFPWWRMFCWIPPPISRFSGSLSQILTCWGFLEMTCKNIIRWFKQRNTLSHLFQESSFLMELSLQNFCSLLEL